MPLLLLIGVGSLIAVTVDLSKIAAANGVGAPEFAFWLSVGAGTVLAALAWLGGKPMPLTRRHLGFYAALGFLSLAAPYVAAFAVAEVAGANYGIAPYALAPLFTYPLAILVGLDQPEWRRFGGLLIGFFGAVLILIDITAVTASAGSIWALAALSIPTLVAIGNVLRTLYMPSDTTDLPLASGIMLGSAFWLSPILLFSGRGVVLVDLSSAATLLIIAQIAVSALHYWLYMRLQRAGGPVYLSQIGYVAAALGVVLAYALFAELPTLPLLVGIVLVATGVILVRPRRHERS